MRVLQLGCVRAALGILEQTAELWETGGTVLDRIAERGMETVAEFGHFHRTNCQILKQIMSVSASVWKLVLYSSMKVEGESKLWNFCCEVNEIKREKSTIFIVKEDVKKIGNQESRQRERKKTSCRQGVVIKLKIFPTGSRD